MPRHTPRNRHRILGTTDASHRGRIRCTMRRISQVTGIIEARPRLRASRDAALAWSVSRLRLKSSEKAPLWKTA
jgi:hypothetical protein